MTERAGQKRNWDLLGDPGREPEEAKKFSLPRMVVGCAIVHPTTTGVLASGEGAEWVIVCNNVYNVSIHYPLKFCIQSSRNYSD